MLFLKLKDNGIYLVIVYYCICTEHIKATPEWKLESPTPSHRFPLICLSLFCCGNPILVIAFCFSMAYLHQQQQFTRISSKNTWPALKEVSTFKGGGWFNLFECLSLGAPSETIEKNASKP